jgi:hypothetical protein
MLKRLIPTAILAFFALFQAHSQETNYGLWAGAELKKELFDRLEVTLAPEVRTTDRFSTLDEMLVDAIVDFEAIKYLTVFGSYRISQFYDDKKDDRFIKQRFTAGLKSKVKLSRFRLGYQFRFQNDLLSKYTQGENLTVERNLRNKLSISYNIPKSKLTPYLSGELFYDISPEKQREFNKYRLRLGSTIPFSKRKAIEVFIQFQQQMNAKKNDRQYTLGLFYSFEFRKGNQQPVEPGNHD